MRTPSNPSIYSTKQQEPKRTSGILNAPRLRCAGPSGECETCAEEFSRRQFGPLCETWLIEEDAWREMQVDTLLFRLPTRCQSSESEPKSKV